MSCRGVSEEHLLKMAAAVEAGTRHPIADAVMSTVHERQLDVPQAEDARSQPGSGAACTLGGKQVRRAHAKACQFPSHYCTTACSGPSQSGQLALNPACYPKPCNP